MNTSNTTDTRIPVTVLTGFLGSGKTTLLNRILTENHGKRIAVIENEYGEIGIDHELVVKADEEIFEMNNGCICCTVRGDLIRILGNLAKRRDRFDYVLIETTGLADPGPVAQTFFVDDDVKAQFRLDGIVTLVDARHVVQHLDTSSECQEQIAFADRLILNKTDLVSPDELARLETRLKGMNALARLRATQQAAVPLDEVLNVRAFDLDTKLAVDRDFLKEELPFEWSGEFALAPGVTELVFQPGPDPLMALAVLPLAGATEAARNEARCEAVKLFSTAGTSVRLGGELTPGAKLWKLVFRDDTTVFRLRLDRSGIYRFFTQHQPSEFALEVRRDGRTLEPEAPVEHAAAHTHDATVSSVGIRQDGSLDLKRLQQWLGELLQTRGADIFRMKGVLCIQGEPRRFIFQGVHMLFDGRPDRPWRADEPRANQLVFIGRNLNREALNAAFRRCLA